MRLQRKNKDGLVIKIDQLYQKARQLYEQGQYEEAIDSFEEVREIVKENYGDPPENALGGPHFFILFLTLRQLALVYTEIGDYTKAEPLFQKALEIRRKALGEDDWDYALVLRDLAEMYVKMSDYTKAEPLYQKALEILRKPNVRGENHQDYADSMSSLALMYTEIGDYTKAEPLYQKALEIYRQVFGENHRDYAIGLDKLAALYTRIGDYTKAEALSQKALEILRKVLGENHQDYAANMSNLALMYVERGDYTKAEPLYQKALEIRRQVFGENHRDYAASMSNLAALYHRMRDYTKAEPLFQKALKIYRHILGKNDLDYAIGLGYLASMYVERGDYTKAEPLFQKALEIWRKPNVRGENHPGHAIGLDNLALVYAATSRQSEALDLLQESVSVEDKILDQVFSITSERQRMSFIMTIRATFYKFLSLVFQQFSKDPQVIQNAVNLVIRRKSIVAEATTVQREVVLTGKYPQLESTLIEHRNIRTQISQRSFAGPYPIETLDKYKQNLEELNSKKEKLERELARQIPEIQIQKSLKTVNYKTISNALPEGAVLIEFVRFDNYNFQAIPANGDLQWHSPRYLAFILRSKEPHNVQMIDLGEAESIDGMVTRFRMSIIEGRASAQENQDENQDDGRHLVAVDTSDTPSSFHNLNQNNNNPSWIDTGYELYKLIFPSSLLSAIGENHKKIFIAPDGDLTRLPFEVLPTSKDNSGTKLLIDDYSITYLTTARDILQIDKVSDRLPNESIVAADPDFDLDSNRSNSSTNIIKSAHTYGHNTESTEEQMIISRPISSRLSRDFDRNTINFNRLDETKEEGQKISKLIGVQPWTSENVLESKIKTYRSPKILHIATHGFFLENPDDDHPNKDKNSGIMGITEDDDGTGGTNIFNRFSSQTLENPMLRSGLALAGANTWIKGGTLPEEAEDGILTAEDVSMMDLTDTELVVLSACETGLGQVHTGEGVFGLRRSFVLAGAKTLVMSLWKVPDEQTKDLMIDFYKRLLTGTPRAQALRKAQIEMKKNPKYSHPLYWGAFICQGNPGPLLNQQVMKK